MDTFCWLILRSSLECYALYYFTSVVDLVLSSTILERFPSQQLVIQGQ